MSAYPFIVLDEEDEAWIVLDTIGDQHLLAVHTSGRLFHRLHLDSLRVDDMGHADLLDQVVNRRQRLRMERPGSGTMGRAW